jgi:hypothetical protein
VWYLIFGAYFKNLFFYWLWSLKGVDFSKGGTKYLGKAVGSMPHALSRFRVQDLGTNSVSSLDGLSVDVTER